MAGPGSNTTGTRIAKTLLHNRSKYKYGSKATPQLLAAKPPVLPPGFAAGYATQMQGLQTQFAAGLAQARMGIGEARATFRETRADIAAQARAGMVEAEAGAQDAGLLGGSADMKARASVISERDRARIANRHARAQAIAQAKLGRMETLGNYYMGVGQLQADKAAQQAELAAQQFQNNQLMLLQQNYAKTQKAVLRNLRGQTTGLPGQATNSTPGRLGAGKPVASEYWLRQYQQQQRHPNRGGQVMDPRWGPR